MISQLKYQKLRAGSCTEEVLEWFNYLHTSAHLRCQMGYQIDLHHRFAVLCQGQPTGEISFIMPESGPTHSIAAKLPRCLSFAVCTFCPASEECCEWGYRWECVKHLCQMSWYLKSIRTIAAIYVSSAELLIVMQEFSMMGSYTEDLKTVKLEDGGLCGAIRHYFVSYGVNVAWIHFLGVWCTMLTFLF